MGLIDRFTGREELIAENDRLRHELRRLREASAGADADATPVPGDPAGGEDPRAGALRRLVDIAAALNAQPDLEATLRQIVLEILAVTGGAQAHVVLREPGELVIELALDARGEPLDEERRRLSRTIAEDVARSGEPIVTGSAARSQRLAAIGSVRALKLESVLCLPLRCRAETVGSVWVGDDRPDAFASVDAALVQAFVDLAGVVIERLRAEQARLRQARLASVGMAASHLLHDLASPLGVLRLAADALAQQPGRERMASRTRAQCDRVAAMITDVLDFVRGGGARLRRAPHRLREIIGELADSLEPALRRQDVSLELEIAFEDEVALDRDRILRALDNLARNAMAVTGAGGRVRIAARRAGERVEVSVADEGPGIDPADRERIFDPFHRGSTGGTGLGLAMVREVVLAHGGAIRVEDAEPRGTRFVVELPLAPPPADAAEETAP